MRRCHVNSEFCEVRKGFRESPSTLSKVSGVRRWFKVASNPKTSEIGATSQSNLEYGCRSIGINGIVEYPREVGEVLHEMWTTDDTMDDSVRITSGNVKILDR
jgi:hypothetical protein